MFEILCITFYKGLICFSCYIINSEDDSFESEMQRALDNIKISSSPITSTMTSSDETSSAQSQESSTPIAPSKTIDVKLGSITNPSSDDQTSSQNKLDLTIDKPKQNVGRVRSNDCDEVRVMQKVLANEV